MTSSPPLFSMRGVTHNFGRFRALHGIELEIRPGETVAVFGSNGAGKTTLLKIAATLLGPQRGELLFEGRPLRGSARTAYRRVLGFAGHATFLYADLSAEENLILHARLRAVPEPVRRADDLLRRVGLWERRRERPTHFSRGMQQRASLARALVSSPRFLLLDEPFSGLDAPGAAAVEQLIREHRQSGRSTLLASHDLQRVLALADRFLVLEHGMAKGHGDCSAYRGLPAHEINLQRLCAVPA